MYLSDTTKDKILNVKDYYEKRDLMVDASFINSVLALIQKDALFKYSFHYELTEEKNMVMLMHAMV